MQRVKPVEVYDPDAGKVKAPRKIWDNYEIVAEVRKSAKAYYKIAHATRDGVRYLHISEWYKKLDGTYTHSRDNLVIPLMIPGAKRPDGKLTMLHPATALIAAMTAALPGLETFDLSNPEKAVWYTK